MDKKLPFILKLWFLLVPTYISLIFLGYVSGKNVHGRSWETWSMKFFTVNKAFYFLRLSPFDRKFPETDEPALKKLIPSENLRKITFPKPPGTQFSIIIPKRKILFWYSRPNRWNIFLREVWRYIYMLVRLLGMLSHSQSTKKN